MDNITEKAKHNGKEVTLDKPFRLPSGHSKKFGVYVKDGDNIRKVTFGDPDMEIRRDDKEARANFRARHNCDTQKDKTTAAYWSCRMWDEDITVSELTEKLDVSGEAQVLKVDETLGLVFGWAIVCKVNGEDYYDLNVDRTTGERVPEHITEKAMLEGALGLAAYAVAKEMHVGEQIGTIPFMFPLTTDIAKSMQIETPINGLMIAMKPNDPSVTAKFAKGEYTGFSIGGFKTAIEEIEE